MSSAKLAAWDKILSNQRLNCELFAGSAPLERTIYETAMWASGLRPAAVAFKLENTPMFTLEEMASTPLALGFMQFLIHLTEAQTVFEIGTFIGVSALYFAHALPPRGRVWTVEKFDHFAEIARRNFAANGFAGKISLLQGDAHDIIPRLPCEQRFDLAFIDGDKERYADYFHMLISRIRPGGLIVADDALFHGDALNPRPGSAKGRGVRELLEVTSRLDGWQRILLPISNGMLLMRKPG